MHTNGIPNPKMSASAADCARLWATLTSEYIPGLRIDFKILAADDDVTGFQLELVDDGPAAADGVFYENVWASKTAFNQLHLITAYILFDLLITGYRNIDDFFRYGESNAPVRRAK